MSGDQTIGAVAPADPRRHWKKRERNKWLTKPVVNNETKQETIWAIPLAAYFLFGLTSGVLIGIRSKNMLNLIILPALGFLQHLTYGAGFPAGLIEEKRVKI